MSVSAGAKTDVGRQRSKNDDAYLVADPLFVVADGMGGHVGGDVASASTIETISKGFNEHPPHDGEELAELVQSANERVFRMSREDASLSGMGTTCTAVMINEDGAYLAHVGDSRAYLLRDNELEQVSEDHTLVQRMVNEGRLTPEEANHHPQRNIITRALGVDSSIDVDVVPLELRPGDTILLNSDGLTSMVDDDVIRDVLVESDDPQAAADKLVELANEAGGEDNITVLVLRVDDGEVSSAISGPGGSAAEHTDTEQPAGDDSGPAQHVGIVEVSAPGRGWRRRIAIATVVIVVLAGVGYGGLRFALSNSWFVGTNESGFVTIYQGIPEDVGGLSLKQSEEVTTLAITDLPQFKRADVKHGIKVDSLADARTTVESLQRIATEAQPSPSPSPNPKRHHEKNKR